MNCLTEANLIPFINVRREQQPNFVLGPRHVVMWSLRYDGFDTRYFIASAGKLIIGSQRYWSTMITNSGRSIEQPILYHEMKNISTIRCKERNLHSGLKSEKCPKHSLKRNKKKHFNAFTQLLNFLKVWYCKCFKITFLSL